MSHGKTEHEMHRDGVFVTLESLNKSGVENIIAAYNMGLNDAWNEESEDGRVYHLRQKCRYQKQEIKALHLRIGREAAKHDLKLARIRHGVGQMRALISRASATSPNGQMNAAERELVAFLSVLEKEVG